MNFAEASFLVTKAETERSGPGRAHGRACSDLLACSTISHVTPSGVAQIDGMQLDLLRYWKESTPFRTTSRSYREMSVRRFSS